LLLSHDEPDLSTCLKFYVLTVQIVRLDQARLADEFESALRSQEAFSLAGE